MGVGKVPNGALLSPENIKICEKFSNKSTKNVMNVLKKAATHLGRGVRRPPLSVFHRLFAKPAAVSWGLRCQHVCRPQ